MIFFIKIGFWLINFGAIKIAPFFFIQSQNNYISAFAVFQGHSTPITSYFQKKIIVIFKK